MQITSASLDSLRTDFEIRFQGAYDNIQVWYNRFCTDIPSKSKSNTYGWGAFQSVLREWIGPRVAQNLGEHSQVVVNKPYEGTIELDKYDIEDDNLGIFQAVAIPGLAQAAKKHPDQLVAALLAANPTTFDGKALFAGDHPCYDKAGSTYDNDYGSTRLDGDGFAEVYAGMSSIVGENGQPLNISPKLLIVPPQLQFKAKTLMNSAFYALPTGGVGGSGNSATIENQFKGIADVLVVPELAGSPKVWYLADVDKAVRPIVFQLRQAAQFVARDQPTDPKVFEQRKFTYGVDYRCAVTTSLPFLIARATEP